MIPVFAEAIASIAIRAVQSLLPNTPQDKLDLLKLQIQEEAQNNELLKGQMAVNAEEAKSESIFVSGWRPCVGWVCASSFAWQFLLQPALTYLIIITGHQVPPMPAFDFATMSTVLFGMLGIGAMRSYDKMNKNK